MSSDVDTSFYANQTSLSHKPRTQLKSTDSVWPSLLPFTKKTNNFIFQLSLILNVCLNSFNFVFITSWSRFLFGCTVVTARQLG